MAQTVGKVKIINDSIEILNENGQVINLEEGQILNIGDNLQGVVQEINGQLEIVNQNGEIINLEDGQSLSLQDNVSNNEIPNSNTDITNVQADLRDAVSNANLNENINTITPQSDNNTIVELNNGQQIIVNNQNPLLLDNTVLNNVDNTDTTIERNTFNNLNTLANDLADETNLVTQTDTENTKEIKEESDSSHTRVLDRNADVLDIQATLRDPVVNNRVIIKKVEEKPFELVKAAILSIDGVTSVIEGNKASYTLSVNEIPTSNIIVKLSYSGIAIDGTDYISVKTVIIPAGSKSVNFEISTIDDYFAEGTEPYKISISEISGGGYKSLIINPSKESITTNIVDTKSPAPTNETADSEDTIYVKISGDASTKEIEDNVISHTLALVDKDGNLVTVPANTTIKVKLTYSNDTTESEDFISKIVEIDIPAGSSSIDISNIVKADNIYEIEEGYKLNIEEVIDTNNVFEKLEISHINNSVVGTIYDEDKNVPNDKEGDKPVVSIEATDDRAVEGTQNNTIVYTVSQNNVSNFDTTVDLSLTLNEVEVADITSITYTNSTGTVITLSDATAINNFVTNGAELKIVAGQTSAPVITITVADDAIYEIEESLSMSISNPTNATLGTISDTAKIEDEDKDNPTTDTPPNDKEGDKPTLSVSNISVTEGTDDYAQFIVSLSNESIQDVIFDLSLANIQALGTGIDYGSATASNIQISTDNGTNWVNGTSATISAGSTSILVRIPIMNDAIAENNETFKLIATVTSGDVTNVTAPFGIGTIIDNDHAPTAQDKVIGLAKNSSDVIEYSDFGFADVDGDSMSKIQITAVEDNGKLLYFDGSSWNDVLLNQEITKADIDAGKLMFRPDTNETGVPYTTFNFKVNDGTQYSDVSNTITYNVANELTVSNPLPVYEGKSAVFMIDLSSTRIVDTLLDLSVGGVDSLSDYNNTLYYKKLAVNGQSWTWEEAVGNQVTIKAGDTRVEVKIVTLNDVVSDNAESLTLTATINGYTQSDMANITDTGATTINEYPSLIVSAPLSVIEGNEAIFEVGLTEIKITDTIATLSFSGVATVVDDYSLTTYWVSTDEGLTWSSIVSNTITIPGSSTEVKSVLVKVSTTSDLVTEVDESLILTANTTDVGISNTTASDKTFIVDKVTLSVLEEKDNDGDTSVNLTPPSTYTYEKIGNGTNGIVVDNGDGTLTYKPDTNYSGTDFFSYYKIDAAGIKTTAKAEVTVIAVADTPEISIGANLVIPINLFDSPLWYNDTSGSAISSANNIVYSGAQVNTTSSVVLSAKEYIINIFDIGAASKLSLLYTGSNVTSYWAYYSGNPATPVTDITAVTLNIDGSITVPTLSSGVANTLIIASTTTGQATTNISNIELKQYVETNSKVYDVIISNSLTDTDSASAQNEELQNVTLVVKDSAGTIINSSGYFNQGTYDSGAKTWTFTQSQLIGLKVTVATSLSTSGFSLESTATSKELSNNDTASNTASVSIIISNNLPIIGDSSISISNISGATQTINNVDTTYGDGTNNFSWNPSKTSIPELYADGQKVEITYDSANGIVKGTINNGLTVVFTATLNMADSNATTVSYTQGSELLGVKILIDGDIILPGGGNNDYRIFQFTDTNGSSNVVVDALVSAHNLIEDSAADLVDSDAEHTVNTNNYYIGVDSNNMNAGQQLIFDFETIGTYDGITTQKNEVTEVGIKLFNFGSEKSGDELYITVTTIFSTETIRLTQDSDYDSELRYTVKSESGDPITKIEFLAGNESSFKLGIESIGYVDYSKTFEIGLAYDITDSDGDTDAGLTTIKVGSGIAESSLELEQNSRINYDSTDSNLDAGNGVDTLILGSGINLDFDNITNITNIEKIDLNENGVHNITNIEIQDVIDITDSNNILEILGDSSDSVNLKNGNGGTWTQTADNVNGFDTYSKSGDSSAVTLKIDQDITTNII